MESTAARLEVKPTLEVKKQLQGILTKLNDYIRKHPATVRSSERTPAPERLVSIKKIAEAIYKYYDTPLQTKSLKDISSPPKDLATLLLEDFESHLKDFYIALDAATRDGKTIDASKFKLLPELKEHYGAKPLPFCLHHYHNILALVRSELKKMPDPVNLVFTSFGSTLKAGLMDALVGADILAKKLGTNVYMVIYSDDLSIDDLNKKPEDFSKLAYEALTTSKVYQGCLVHTFKGSSKSYHVTFGFTKEEAINRLTADGHEKAGCIGIKFSFTLQTPLIGGEGQYIPLLPKPPATIEMEVWKKDDKGQITANEHLLELHNTRPMFVIIPQENTLSLIRPPSPKR